MPSRTCPAIAASPPRSLITKRIGPGRTVDAVQVVIAERLVAACVHRIGDTGDVAGVSDGYEPFGTTGMLTGSITQDLRLPDQTFDAESAIYHNGARNYLPTLGRYAESDPIGLLGGVSTYTYTLNNPLK
jgi:RHS repeat-associated protein